MSRLLGPDRTMVWMLTNPRAGARAAGERVTALEEALTSQQYVVERFTNPADLRDAVATRNCAALRAVVAAGGDGTANLVADMLPPEIPFIPLPLGTENLLAKHLGLTSGPPEVAQAICGGRVEQFDAGTCNGQLFLLMIGAGFDAEVVRRLHSARTGHIRHLSYAAPIFRTIWEYPYPELRVRYTTNQPDNGGWQEVRGSWVFVINLPRYAGGLSFVPQASGQDGLLDLCVFKSGSLWKGLYYLANVVMGQHQQLDDCLVAKVAEAQIEVVEPESSVAYQYDGDPGDVLPATIQVVPGRCAVIVPEDWDHGPSGGAPATGNE